MQTQSNTGVSFSAHVLSSRHVPEFWQSVEVLNVVFFDRDSVFFVLSEFQVRFVHVDNACLNEFQAGFIVW